MEKLDLKPLKKQIRTVQLFSLILKVGLYFGVATLVIFVCNELIVLTVREAFIDSYTESFTSTTSFISTVCGMLLIIWICTSFVLSVFGRNISGKIANFWYNIKIKEIENISTKEQYHKFVESLDEYFMGKNTIMNGYASSFTSTRDWLKQKASDKALRL